MSSRKFLSLNLNPAVLLALSFTTAALIASGCATARNANDDAGTSAQDSGVWSFPDLGTSADLGTTTQEDLGTSTQDLGTTADDAGTTTDDAGTTVVDSGTSTDSGTASDSGTSTDSGSVSTDGGVVVVGDAGGGPLGVTCGGAHNKITGTGSMILTGTIDGYSANARMDCGNTGGTGFGTYFEFVPPVSGSYTIDTEGSAFDTVLSVLPACDTDPSMDITCNDDAVPGSDIQSSVTFAAVGGTSYFLWLDTYDSMQSGAFNVNVTLALGMTCGDAHPTIRATGPSVLTGSIATYSSNVRMDCAMPQSTQFGGYFEFVAPSTGTFTIDTAGSMTMTGRTLDTILTAYSTCDAAPSADLVCDDDVSSSDYTSSIVLSATSGHSYFIWVDGYHSTTAGTFVVNITSGGTATDGGVDAGTDAGPTDAGHTDAGHDAAVDAGHDAGPVDMGSSAPTWTTIYNTYFGSGTPGHCGNGGCHSSSRGGFTCGSSKTTCYNGLVSAGYVTDGDMSSAIADPSQTPLGWYGSGGNMPAGGASSNAAAARDISAWVAAGAHNN